MIDYSVVEKFDFKMHVCPGAFRDKKCWNYNKNIFTDLSIILVTHVNLIISGINDEHL